MDTANLVSSMTNMTAAETAMKVQYAVAAKMLNMQETQGAAMVQLIAAASQSFEEQMSALQGLIDSTAALDVYA